MDKDLIEKCLLTPEEAGDKMVKVTYDREAKALYVYCLEGDFGELTTEELVRGAVWLDKTNVGQIYGIEVLDVELESI